MWKDFVRKRGVVKTASDLEVSRQTLHSWLTDAVDISKKAMKGIIILSRGELSFSDFYPEDK